MSGVISIGDVTIANGERLEIRAVFGNVCKNWVHSQQQQRNDLHIWNSRIIFSLIFVQIELKKNV